MAKRATGEVIERKRKGGRVFALRFRAYGRRHFITLGGAEDGWTRQKAEAELRHVLADVDRGLWAPGVTSAREAPAAPTFHEFASEWLEARRGELKETTIADYTWQLCNHLLPFFHRHRLPQITVAEVDRYRDHKVRERVLSAESINKTITRLGQILAVAEERDLIPRNPVRVNTRNRKLKARRKRPVYLDSAEQIVAMIDAATELDARPEARTAGRRALIATLVYAGLRIGEATALTWQDIDLANGRITVVDSKTEAGIRLVDILPGLRDELTSHRHANADALPSDLVFPTSTGSRRDKDNARERVIRPVVARAEELLAERGHQPLPQGVTAHKLRHTFASILYVRGEDPPYVMQQLGHSDPGFTLRVYAHAMRRDDGDKERLKSLVEGRHWAPLGTERRKRRSNQPATTAPEDDETPAGAGPSDHGRGRARTADLSRVKRALSQLSYAPWDGEILGRLRQGLPVMGWIAEYRVQGRRVTPGCSSDRVRFSGAFPAERESVRRARDRVAEVARECGLAEDALYNVRLAVTEVVTNAITHAYGGGSKDGEIRVQVFHAGGELLVIVADDGPGMAPRLESPGLGLGLPVVASAVERLEIVTPDRGGTEVHMVFPCSG